jgi:hypothetical protein
MASADAATRYVIDRCPICGVEHDARARACEACDTPLRAWCRVHSRDIGWLDDAACARCAEDAARRTRRAAAPSLAMPCPAPSMPASIPAASSLPAGVAPPHGVVAEAAKPSRPLRPQEHFGVMFLMLLLSTASVTLAAVVAAFLYLLSGRGTLPDTALRFAAVGAVVGLVIGILTAVHYATTIRTPRRAP